MLQLQLRLCVSLMSSHLRLKRLHRRLYQVGADKLGRRLAAMSIDNRH